jgi:hypothetical protein
MTLTQDAQALSSGPQRTTKPVNARPAIEPQIAMRRTAMPSQSRFLRQWGDGAGGADTDKRCI